MKQTYITDALGTELPLTEERDTRAVFHFTRVGTITHGTVWRCDEIHGRHMRHRLTFSSYYADSSVSSTRTMGFLLYDQMLRHEGVAEWEASLRAAELAEADQVAA